MCKPGDTMWFWGWRALLLVLMIAAAVLVGQQLGEPWPWLLPLPFSLIAGPALIQRWRQAWQVRGESASGSTGSGQERTD